MIRFAIFLYHNLFLFFPANQLHHRDSFLVYWTICLSKIDPLSQSWYGDYPAMVRRIHREGSSHFSTGDFARFYFIVFDLCDPFCGLNAFAFSENRFVPMSFTCLSLSDPVIIIISRYYKIFNICIEI